MTTTHAVLSEKLYTVAEFKKMPELHGRYELIEGRLIEKPIPKYGHSDILFEDDADDD
jgi:Uma2 family endonuclease